MIDVKRSLSNKKIQVFDEVSVNADLYMVVGILPNSLEILDSSGDGVRYMSWSSAAHYIGPASREKYEASLMTYQTRYLLAHDFLKEFIRLRAGL